MAQRWTHRATWPDKPETIATDRVVLLDGEAVGRVKLATERYPAKVWQWTGLWSGQAVGATDAMEDALEALRRAYDKAVTEEPERIADMVSRRKR